MEWLAQAIAVETKNLSRAVMDEVLVRDISVQVQKGGISDAKRTDLIKTASLRSTVNAQWPDG
jgi:hypothetical protein